MIIKKYCIGLLIAIIIFGAVGGGFVLASETKISAKKNTEKKEVTNIEEPLDEKTKEEETNVSSTKEKYTITFMADDKEVSKVEYEQDATSIKVPDVPKKEGYTGSWEEYELDNTSKTVKAVYVLSKISYEEFLVKYSCNPGYGSQYFILDNCTYFFNGDYSLSTFGGFNIPYQIVPASIDGYIVTTITASFIKGDIELLELPPTITTVDSNAYMFGSVKKVKAPESLRELDLATIFHCEDIEYYSV